MNSGLINVPNPLSLATGGVRSQRPGLPLRRVLWEELDTWRALPLFPVSFTAQVGARWKGIGKE